MDILNVTECAKEIAQVLEKYNVTAGNMNSVLNATKELILSNTPIHIE